MSDGRPNDVWNGVVQQTMKQSGPAERESVLFCTSIDSFICVSNDEIIHRNWEQRGSDLIQDK